MERANFGGRGGKDTNEIRIAKELSNGIEDWTNEEFINASNLLQFMSESGKIDSIYWLTGIEGLTNVIQKEINGSVYEYGLNIAKREDLFLYAMKYILTEERQGLLDRKKSFINTSIKRIREKTDDFITDHDRLIETLEILIEQTNRIDFRLTETEASSEVLEYFPDIQFYKERYFGYNNGYRSAESKQDNNLPECRQLLTNTNIRTFIKNYVEGFVDFYFRKYCDDIIADVYESLEQETGSDIQRHEGGITSSTNQKNLFKNPVVAAFCFLIKEAGLISMGTNKVKFCDQVCEKYGLKNRDAKRISYDMEQPTKKHLIQFRDLMLPTIDQQTAEVIKPYLSLAIEARK